MGCIEDHANLEARLDILLNASKEIIMLLLSYHIIQDDCGNVELGSCYDLECYPSLSIHLNTKVSEVL